MQVSLVLFLILSLLLGRKTVSYISIGPIYWIEFLLLTALFFAVFRLLACPRCTPPVGITIQSATILAFLYFIYSVAIVLIYGFDQPKELILSLYILHYLLTLFIFHASSINSLFTFKKLLLLILPLTPLLIFLFKPFFIMLFGELKAPGGTFIYPVAFLMSLIFVKNVYLRLLLSLVSAAFIFLSFERASILNMLVMITVLSFSLLYKKEYSLLKIFWKRLALMAVMALIALTAIFPLFDFSGFRYSINLSSFFDFIMSSFLDEGAFTGTRNHRLEMWSDVIHKISNGSTSTFLFGHGFYDTVADTAFRAIHNDFISIFYRVGFVGFTLYISFLMFVFRQSIRLMEYDMEVSVMALIVLLAFSSDALTGTIITSPFLSVIVYIIFAYQSVLLYRYQQSKR